MSFVLQTNSWKPLNQPKHTRPLKKSLVLTVRSAKAATFPEFFCFFQTPINLGLTEQPMLKKVKVITLISGFLHVLGIKGSYYPFPAHCQNSVNGIESLCPATGAQERKTRQKSISF